MVSTSAAVVVDGKIHQSSSGTFSIVRICIQSLTKLSYLRVLRTVPGKCNSGYFFILLKKCLSVVRKSGHKKMTYYNVFSFCSGTFRKKISCSSNNEKGSRVSISLCEIFN